jgi:hypothetical protein
MYLPKGKTKEVHTMKNPKTMTYKELENEVIKNRCELRTAALERKRELINRDHDLMTEMNRRWEAKGGKR